MVNDADDVVDLAATAPSARAELRIRLSRFNLPPVQSALVVGKRASIGSRAMAKALDEMMPGAFRRIDVDHPLIESILCRDAHLRRISAEKLVPLIVRHAEAFMADTDTLHFDINIDVFIRESVEL
ncbi:MAG: hypothetical protein KC593_03000 [Myxococcales bacterium]|nr:hypothetical protein [Myxococcales bacterium]MCB9628551.1 hypothetical protein [Sandaracinaceae bacterium]